MKTVLMIEDNIGDVRLVREMFNEQGQADTELTQADCMDDAEKQLSWRTFDIVLLDLGLQDAQGLDAVRRARRAAPHIPLVVLTGLDDEALAVSALHEGAQDYLLKDQIDTRGLLRALRHAIERKAMEEALFAETEHAHVTLDAIGEAVISTDGVGNVRFLNMVAELLTGWSRREAVGRPSADVFVTLNAVDRGPGLTQSELVGGQSRLHYPAPPVLLVRRDGRESLVEVNIAPMHNREGRRAGVVLVFHDISAQRSQALQVVYSAEHDLLTNLPNRRLLNDRITQAIARARRHGHQIAVLVLDLDGFKHINDSLGHPIGDQLLQSVAPRLVECVGEGDTVSRQGGDEFVVLLSDVEPPDFATKIAKRMLEAVGEPHLIEGHELHITASIGISVYPGDGTNVETLLKNADTALYQAKENGRESFQFFKADMNVRAVERQSLEAGLRRALKQDEFQLYYQPKIDLKTGMIAGAEALIRWNHAERGMVPPGSFIPLAEESGIILSISAWVMREACRQNRAWSDQGCPKISVAVNVSGMEFRREGFLDGLFRTLDETGMDPTLLEIELTEGVLMDRADASVEILETLRQRGIKVALDDFGTGYSSLSYLRKFPLDALKIDYSFIHGVGSPGPDTTILTAVISLARSLNLRVVAEGVETFEELAFLHSQKCDEVQGYYFSRPVPAAEFEEFLKGGIPAADQDWLTAHQ
jgi:diguanylate cyclase (GGDEF)-like protein/PAS domain S-box-containing protein